MNKDFASYGGRGITICDRWKTSFANFFADMGPRPSPKHSLDRKENDGPYDPRNCRWATRSEQQQNKRDNTRVRGGNHMLTLRGETLPIATWARRLNLSWNILYKRVNRGWSEDRILQAHP